MVIGNVMYSLSTNVWMLLAGRFVVGVAAANYAVAQTYLSYATTLENRTKVMALNSAATVLGFIIGPAFALFTTFGEVDIHGIAINSYTLPGYVSAAMSIFGMFILVFLKEIPASFKKHKKPVQGGSATYGSGFYSGGGSIKDVSQILLMSKQRKIPLGPVLVCLFSYFSYTTSFTVFETIGTPYTKDAFGWGVRENSIMFIVLGVVCVSSLVVLQLLVRCLNDRVLVVGCTALSVAGFVVLFDPYKHFVPKWRFWLGVAFCSASYSTSVAVLISVYSKQLENLDQGMMMGWLSSAGSVAELSALWLPVMLFSMEVPLGSWSSF
jgi:MFS family permease